MLELLAAAAGLLLLLLLDGLTRKGGMRERSEKRV
jgi:hypothetical protein